MIPLYLVVASDFPWLTCFLSPHSSDLLLCLILRCNLYFSPIEKSHLKAPRRPMLHIRKQWKHLLSSLFLLPGFLFCVYLFVFLIVILGFFVLFFLHCGTRMDENYGGEWEGNELLESLCWGNDYVGECGINSGQMAEKYQWPTLNSCYRHH